MRLPFNLNCEWADEIFVVAVAIFVGGLVWHIDQQNERIHALTVQNAEMMEDYTRHIAEIKSEAERAKSQAEARGARLQKLDKNVEVLQMTIEEQHKQITDLLRKTGALENSK